MSESRHTAAIDIPPGGEVSVSDWILVDQKMIDGFGAVTLDPDPMHIVPAWAATGPFGGTIAFGFLTVSLLTRALHSAMGTEPGKDAATLGHYLNYGFDRLRLVTPVPVGARVRGHFWKLRQREDEKRRLLTTFGCRIEIEGVERPALVAEWLSIWVPAAG